jgi:hypothetical protein
MLQVVVSYAVLISSFGAWIDSHCNHTHCNRRGEGRERDCAAAVMWKSTELMPQIWYDAI